MLGATLLLFAAVRYLRRVIGSTIAVMTRPLHRPAVSGERHFVPDAGVQLVLDRLASLPEGLRQVLADQQWSKIPLSVDESAFQPSQPANVPLIVTRQTDGLELITSVVASVPSGATGVIQLGWTQIPFSGLVCLSPLNKLLQGGDVRSVTSSLQGPVSLWLTGEQRPATSVFAS